MIPAHQLGAIKVAEQQKPLDPICEMTPEGPSLALDQLTGVSFSQDGPLHPGNRKVRSVRRVPRRPWWRWLAQRTSRLHHL
jgi:hypothetical protein